MKLDKQIRSLMKKGRCGPMPKSVEPMLATLVTDPVKESGWFYEMKWDGYRAVAYMNGQVDLCSRNNKSFNQKYYPLYRSLKDWGIDAVVDGEIVVINDKGLPDFSNLQ